MNAIHTEYIGGWKGAADCRPPRERLRPGLGDLHLIAPSERVQKAGFYWSRPSYSSRPHLIVACCLACCRLSIDLQTGKPALDADVALHFNPRLDENLTVSSHLVPLPLVKKDLKIKLTPGFELSTVRRVGGRGKTSHVPHAGRREGHAGLQARTHCAGGAKWTTTLSLDESK